MALKAVAAPLGSPVGGSGTTNTIPRWTGPSTLGDSGITDNGTVIGVANGTRTMTFNLVQISGNQVNTPGAGELAIQYATSKNTVIYNGSSPALFVNGTSGNVGIGTASPGAKLEIPFSGTAAGCRIQFASGPFNYFNATNHYFRTLGDADVMTIVSTNVGIGTTSPTAALDVPASTTTRATLRIRSGVAPTAPNTGDVWFDGTSLFMRNGAGTQTVSFGGGGGATAWVNFNGTGVIAIRASSNVSSITDAAVGQYVVNFTSAMPDINYAAIGTKQNVSTNTDVSFYDCINAVASVPARTVNASGWQCLEGAAYVDSANVNVAYFR